MAKKPVKLYHYSRDGYLIGESEARPNPKEPGKYLQPANTTFIKPPEPGENQCVKFVLDAWEIITDYSDWVFYDKETKAIKKYEPGEEPDFEKYTSEFPMGDVDKFDGEKWYLSDEAKLQREQTEAQAYLNSTDWYVTRYVETSTEIPQEVRDKRIQARATLNLSTFEIAKDE